jgi:hypothetical protein
VAAGGWSLFTQTPSEAEQLALAGRQDSVLLPSVRTVTAVPTEAGRAAAEPRALRSAAPGARSLDHPEFPVSAPHPELATPRVPTVVIPRQRAAQPESEVPELLPKTTQGLRDLADSAKALTSDLGAVGRKTAAPAPAELNWDAAARCISGNDPRAVTPDGGHGLYHLTAEDWRSVGGSGLPSEATPAEQTKRAKLLYAKENGRWQELWPECGRLLFAR